MVLRIIYLAPLFACLVCAADQTLVPGLEQHRTDLGDSVLFRALKAASTDALGIAQPNRGLQPRPNFSLDLSLRTPVDHAPDVLMGRVAPTAFPGTRCAIPLTSAPVKSTEDAIRIKVEPGAFDAGIVQPPPAPACTNK